MLKKYHQIILSLFSALMVTACGDAPELPPKESMTLPNFFDKNNNALTADQGSTQAIGKARLAVGVVTGAIRLALLPPQATFWACLQVKAERDGDGWLWKRNFSSPLFNINVDSSLHGEITDKLELSMTVDGNIGDKQLDNFVWYTGEHEVTHGRWTFYQEDVEGDVLTIDWEVNSQTDKTLTFKNVNEHAHTNGDSITYDLDGTKASMTIVDALDDGGNQAQFRVEWDTADGSGKLTDKHGDEYCWDSLKNGQVDIPCE